MTFTIQVFVTGAGGHLGKHLLGHLRNEDRLSVQCVKRLQDGFDLESVSQLKNRSMGGRNVMVHLAWNTTNRKRSAQLRSAQQTIELAKFCHAQDIHLIFVSSMSARESSQSSYGSAKHRAEQAVLALGGAVLRPGLVTFPVPNGVHKLGKQVAGRLARFGIELPDLMVPTVSADHFVASTLDLVLSSSSPFTENLVDAWVPLDSLNRGGMPNHKRHSFRLNPRVITRLLTCLSLIPYVRNRRDSIIALIETNDAHSQTN